MTDDVDVSDDEDFFALAFCAGIDGGRVLRVC